MALRMVTRSRLHGVPAVPTNTHFDAPGLHHVRFRTAFTMTPSRIPRARCPSTKAPHATSTLTGKSHGPLLRTLVRFVAGRKCRNFVDSVERANICAAHARRLNPLARGRHI